MADFSNVSGLGGELFAKMQRGIAIAANNAKAAADIRVFDQGLDSEGNRIQSTNGTRYSEKPFFALRKDFITLNSEGQKNLSSTGKSVQLPEGYKSFRKFSGRKTDRIYLDYSGILRKSYKVRVTEEGFQTGYFGGGESDDNGVTAAEKMAYAESRNGAPIIDPTEEEIDFMVKDIADAIIR